MIGVQERQIARSSAKKFRHNKVYTAKGIRDRRVRLSAETAIQFYDVQDRLGFDRATEAVDWLILKAKASIDKLFDTSNAKQTQQPISAQGDCSLELSTTSHGGFDGSSELPYAGNCSSWGSAVVDFEMSLNLKKCDMFSCELGSNGERFTWSFNSLPNHNDDSSGSGKVPLFQH